MMRSILKSQISINPKCFTHRCLTNLNTRSINFSEKEYQVNTKNSIYSSKVNYKQLEFKGNEDIYIHTFGYPLEPKDPT